MSKTLNLWYEEFYRYSSKMDIEADDTEQEIKTELFIAAMNAILTGDSTLLEPIHEKINSYQNKLSEDMAARIERRFYESEAVWGKYIESGLEGIVIFLRELTGAGLKAIV